MIVSAVLRTAGGQALDVGSRRACGQRVDHRGDTGENIPAQSVAADHPLTTLIHRLPTLRRDQPGRGIERFQQQQDERSRQEIRGQGLYRYESDLTQNGLRWGQAISVARQRSTKGIVRHTRNSRPPIPSRISRPTSTFWTPQRPKRRSPRWATTHDPG